MQKGTKINWNGSIVEFQFVAKSLYTNSEVAILMEQSTDWTGAKREVYFEVQITDALNKQIK
jgi:hypothetical protein